MHDASKNLTIRPASPGERAAIVALWQVCGLTVSHNDPVTDFDFAHDKPNSTVLVGLSGDRLQASVMVGHDGHRGWIYYVSVAPEAQGRGHGGEIVAAAEAWLEARGVPKVMLMIRDTNTAVEAFYRQLGYESMPRIVMQKWLRDPG